MLFPIFFLFGSIFQVGFDDDGKIVAVDFKCYSDTGAIYHSLAGDEHVESFIDNCKNIRNHFEQR